MFLSKCCFSAVKGHCWSQVTDKTVLLCVLCVQSAEMFMHLSPRCKRKVREKRVMQKDRKKVTVGFFALRNMSECDWVNDHIGTSHHWPDLKIVHLQALDLEGWRDIEPAKATI